MALQGDGNMLRTKSYGDDLTRFSDEKNKRGCYDGEEETELLKPGDICLDNTHVWSGRKKEVEDIAYHLSRTVFSLALSAGHTMLFACSGIAIDCTGSTCFMTSASLVRAAEELRKCHDNLKIEVHYEDNVFKGYLVEYDLDLDIALVKVKTHLNVYCVCIDEDLIRLPGSMVVAAGRDISGSIMASSGILIESSCESCSSSESDNSSESKNSNESEDGGELMVSSCKISQAWEGGPLVDFDGNFVGMNLFMVHGVGTVFLPLELIHERVEHFRRSLLRKEFLERKMKLKKLRVGGGPTGDLSSPEIVVNDDQFDLDSMGYPKPPMLHDGMNLVYSFEKAFGDAYGEGTVSDTIRRNVVAVASFVGERRFFACTGFFIEWGDGYATILTSASLVRVTGDANEINENLRIEVFLPCLKQRKEGMLLHYNLHYNVALISIKNIRAARPVIFGHDYVIDRSRNNLLAIGCCFNSGTLMAASGQLTSWSGTLDCKFLAYSTCKITKAGIGGPLVDIKGNFIGMNFYDTFVGTPYLQWNEIVKILAHFKGKRTFLEVRDDAVYSEPFWTMDEDSSGSPNRWPVPKPCWSSDNLEEVPELAPNGYAYSNGKLLMLE